MGKRALPIESDSDLQNSESYRRADVRTQRPDLSQIIFLPSKSQRIFTRFPLVDQVRGFAVMAMILFHLTYDLKAFGTDAVRSALELPGWYWMSAPRIIGGLFFLVLGVSSWLQFRNVGKNPSWLTFVKRGGRVFLIGLLITVITAFASPGSPILFGVLHCIGLTTMLLYPFLAVPRIAKTGWLIGLGLLIVSIGVWLAPLRFSFSWLLWLGFMPATGTGGDWYPLIPWFGVSLLGIAIGKRIYPASVAPVTAVATQPAPPSNLSSRPSFLGAVGRNALIIYVLHQPLLLALLFVLGLLRASPQ